MYFSRIRLRPEFLRSSQLNQVLQDNVYGIHQLLHDLFESEKRCFLFREEIASQQLGYEKNVKGEPVYYLVSRQRPLEDTPLFKVETKAYQPRLMTGQVLTFDCRVNPVVTRNGKKHDVVMNAQLDFLKSAVQALSLQNELPAQPKKSDYKKIILASRTQQTKDYLIHHIQQYPAYAERTLRENTLKDTLEWAIQAAIDSEIQRWFIRQGENRPHACACGFSLLDDEKGGKQFQMTAYQWHVLPKKGKQAGFSSVDLTGKLQINDVNGFEQALFNGIGRAKAFGCGLLMIKKS